MGFLDKIQAKLELYRLEQKYARRKHRTTYTTGAQYVDGEYVYQDATSPMSANSTGNSSEMSGMSFGRSSAGKRRSVFFGK